MATSQHLGLADIRDRATISLYPEAAQILGISKSSVYAAAHDGSVPTLRIGRRLLVPVPRLLAMLGANADETAIEGLAAA